MTTLHENVERRLDRELEEILSMAIWSVKNTIRKNLEVREIEKK
tara:strand:+ start:148 stop:279 length:132 start_codon:yes stop_codon:yes gene_type:complete